MIGLLLNGQKTLALIQDYSGKIIDTYVTILFIFVMWELSVESIRYAVENFDVNRNIYSCD